MARPNFTADEERGSWTMHKNLAKKEIIIAGAIALVAATVCGFFIFYCVGAMSAPEDKAVFVGDSSKLRATEVIATLDTPIPQGKNAIWCASFLAAWKTLEMDLAKEPVALQGSPAIVEALNKADDPRPHIPEESLYTAVGWSQDGITEQIIGALAEKFPDKKPPNFPGITPDSFVAYAYLEADVKFSIPYFQNHTPLVFTDREGRETHLRSFGIRSKDHDSKLRRQPAILHKAFSEEGILTECVIDLDRNSNPNQIIVALMDTKPTLEEMLVTAENMIKKSENKESPNLGSADVLLVPDMIWRIVHHFTELEKKQCINSNMQGLQIEVCQQDTQFRLGRTGAELKSEAKIRGIKSASPRKVNAYIFDRPFLLYMKKRDAEMPYFVMWVENAELLKKWSGQSNLQ